MNTSALTNLIHLVVLMLGKATPLWLACLGGLLSELSGVINFALEGMMLMGAFGAVWMTFWSGSPWVGLLGGALGGFFIGVLHGFICLKMRVNQIVSSIGLNLLAAGISGTLLNQVFDVYGTSPSVKRLPSIGHLMTWLGGEGTLGVSSLIQGISMLAPVTLVFVFAAVWMFRESVWGLRIRACGENPDAARAAGLSVATIRFCAASAGGALAGLGGAYLSIGELSQFVEQMTHGRGYLAIAAVILGRWKPSKVLLAALLFGFCEALSEWLSVRWTALPQQAFLSLPYVICLSVLLFQIGPKRPPSALGRL